MSLIQKLNAKSKKKNYFRTTESMPWYGTGIIPYDYMNGYISDVVDPLTKKVIKSQRFLGVLGGSVNTIIGKSGSAKTALAVKMAGNIVKPFPNAFVYHLDGEGTSNIARVQALTGLDTLDMYGDDAKYILKQEDTFMEEILDAVQQVCEIKLNGGDDYRYFTGLVDEFNRPIYPYVPTVILVDAIPSLASKASEMEEMKGATYAGRTAAAVSQFYKRLMPLVKKYNIVIMGINHLKVKIDMNPYAIKQPSLNYLAIDESMPGGETPIYYASNLLKLATKVSDKTTIEDDGYGGFKVTATICKSKTNMAGKQFSMAFDSRIGFDPVYTQYLYAEEKGLLTGNINNKRFIGHEDIKFDVRKLRDHFETSAEFRDLMFSTTMPLLEKELINSADLGKKTDSSATTVTEIISRIAATQQDEEYDKEVKALDEFDAEKAKGRIA